MSKQLSKFMDFVREQGVVGLAIGLAIGAAAGATVKAIVDGLINPVVGFIIGGNDLARLTWNTGFYRSGKELVIAWGLVANSMITLLAVSAVIYFIVLGLRLDKIDRKKQDK